MAVGFEGLGVVGLGGAPSFRGELDSISRWGKLGHVKSMEIDMLQRKMGGCFS
jgi:hypothetical protein